MQSQRVLCAKAISPSQARMVVRVTGADLRAELSALNSKMPANLTLVAGSEQVIERGRMGTTLLVNATTKLRTMALNEAKASRMIATASNIYIDESNSAWNVSDDGEHLIRDDRTDTAEALDKLLASEVCPHYVALSGDALQYSGYLEASSPRVDSNMWAVFANGTVTDEGYVVALSEDETHAVILPHSDNLTAKEVIVPINHVLAAHTVELDGAKPKLPKDEAKVAVASASTLQGRIDFYKKVYGYNREFFNRFKAALKTSRV